MTSDGEKGGRVKTSDKNTQGVQEAEEKCTQRQGYKCKRLMAIVQDGEDNSTRG